jgi:hypothetical protein
MGLNPTDCSNVTIDPRKLMQMGGGGDVERSIDINNGDYSLLM